jgi:tRNA(Ile)-lysidine synthase
MLSDQEIADFLRQHAPIQQVLLGLSGGIDSVALLHRLANSPLRPALHAIHINHQLQSEAQAWARFCVRLCERLEIPLLIREVSVQAAGQGLEAAARSARYAQYRAALSPQSVLVTAHHQDDQAETVLLRLVRGAGVKGLAGMRRVSFLGNNVHWRPLLSCSKAEILAYAQHHGLEHVNDASNFDIAYDRNYCRQRILPLLQARWPACVEALARTANHCQHSEAVLQEVGREDAQQCRGRVPGTLSVRCLNALSMPRRNNCLRVWIGQRFALPSQRQLTEIESQVLSAGVDKNPRVQCGAAEIRRYQDDCYLLPVQQVVPSYDLVWQDLRQALPVPGLGTLCAERVVGGVSVPPEGLVVRSRRGGESIRLHGREVSKSLKKLFQEQLIPPWQRHAVPLLYVQQELIVVMGVAVAESYQCEAEVMGWRFRWA